MRRLKKRGQILRVFQVFRFSMLCRVEFGAQAYILKPQKLPASIARGPDALLRATKRQTRLSKP